MTNHETRLSVFHGEPDFWSGAHGTKPNPAPMYGRALDANDNVLHLDIDVMAQRSSFRSQPIRAKVVAIGDEGLPDRPICRVRQHGSAVLSGYSTAECTPHHFDEYEWLAAETEAARVMDKRGVDLTRCAYGGFYFEQFQREVMKAYLAAQVPA